MIVSDSEFAHTVQEMNAMHVIDLRQSFKQELCDTKTRTQTDKVIQYRQRLRERIDFLELSFERKIAEIHKKYEPPKKEEPL